MIALSIHYLRRALKRVKVAEKLPTPIYGDVICRSGTEGGVDALDGCKQQDRKMESIWRIHDCIYEEARSSVMKKPDEFKKMRERAEECVVALYVNFGVGMRAIFSSIITNSGAVVRERKSPCRQLVPINHATCRNDSGYQIVPAYTLSSEMSRSLQIAGVCPKQKGSSPSVCRPPTNLSQTPAPAVTGNEGK